MAYRSATATSPATPEIIIRPETVYCAQDRKCPRWRFLLIAINRSAERLTLSKACISQQSRAGSKRQEISGPALKPMLSQGQLRLDSDKALVLDIQELPQSMTTSSAVSIRLTFRTRAGREVLCQRSVSLVPRATRYLQFPLRGQWYVVNARADLHCLGQQYGFDFVVPQDVPIHERPSRRKLQLCDFGTFGQTLYAPAAGEVLACCNDQPDLPPTPGRATMQDGPPKGQPMVVMAGNYIVLGLEDGATVIMGHMKRGSLTVKVGHRVKAGQVLGQLGNSGNTSGPHLHIEMLDSSPDMALLGTVKFRQSGIPFGFRDAIVQRANRRRHHDQVVPCKRDTVTA